MHLLAPALLLVVSLIPSWALAQQGSWGPWEQARSLYDAGKYEEALHAIRSNPVESASYYYNLGTLHHKLGRNGPAVAYLEKANRLEAHNSDIQHNLSVARKALGRLIGDQRLDPASSWVESLIDRVPLDEIRGTLGLLAFVLTLFWTRSYRKTRDLGKTLLQPAGALTLAAFALVGFLYGAQRLAESNPPAAVLDAQSIRSGPGESFIELGRAEAGTKLRLLGQSASAEGKETWHQVRFGASSVGWVKASGLLLL